MCLLDLVLLTRFRDDMHLGPEAMRMIGEGIADDIASNRDNAWFSHEPETTHDGKNDTAGTNSQP